MGVVEDSIEASAQSAADVLNESKRGLRHWQQSVITEPGLERRGNIFFAALEMTRMPMILTDATHPDNPIAFANNAFLDLTGYEEIEVIGRNCRFLQGAGTDREVVAQLRGAVAAREAISIEILNYRRDGTSFWNAVFIGPVYDQTGELLYFFASQLDVTRRRESEQAFRQAQKMEAIGQLTAGLAHDFNNLLHVINASLEQVKAKRLDETAHTRHLQIASLAAERGAKLTKQLLAFARRSRLEPHRVDLTQLITSFSDLLDSSVGSKVELSLKLRRRLPSIVVDPVHLEMALLNIVINARDASSKGGMITVETGRVGTNTAETELIMLAVSDQGIGMPAHVKARATEPFFTTKGPGAGTGLGLAMAHGFMLQSGGRLDIESEPGKGTTVRLFFPIASPEEVPTQDRGYRASVVEKATAPCILVVDDNAEIVELAQVTLEEAGYGVVGATSAEQAIELLERQRSTNQPIGLVISDIVMPGGMSGLELAHAVHEQYPNVPVLLTTGYTDELAFAGVKRDAMDVLGKPYRQSELLNRVQAALQRGVRSGAARMQSEFGLAHE